MQFYITLKDEHGTIICEDIEFGGSASLEAVSEAAGLDEFIERYRQNLYNEWKKIINKWEETNQRTEQI